MKHTRHGRLRRAIPILITSTDEDDSVDEPNIALRLSNMNLPRIDQNKGDTKKYPLEARSFYFVTINLTLVFSSSMTALTWSLYPSSMSLLV